MTIHVVGDSGDILAQLEALRAENARLKAQAQANERSLSLKVSEKGAVSVYGMGRFPVSLYPKQWLKLLKAADTIVAFIETNKDRLSWDKAA